MKIFALRGDVGQACGLYRVQLPIEQALREGAIEATIDNDLPADAVVSYDGTVTVERINVDADVIVFQRPAKQAFVEAIKQAQKQGIACVVEIDDDLSSIDPDNMAYNAFNGSVEHWKHMVEAAKLADWVTVSTPQLASRYAPHGRVTVLRNALPSSIFDIEKLHNDPPRVGWTGSTASHPHDLETLGVHLRTVLRETNTSFHMLGEETGVREQLRLDETDAFVCEDWVPIDDYYVTLAKTIDIGVVPLQLSKFNEAKSYLKGLEMAALGIPFVASPTSEYQLLSKLGAGIVARKGLQWQKELKHFITDRDYLLEQSANMRDAVRVLTYENSIEVWIQAWKSALSQRRVSLTI